METLTFKIKPADCVSHELVDLVRLTNGCSAWGDKICQICGAIHSWQYDYETHHHVTETKPY